MLRYPLIHPPLISALASAGHGSTILIADGNYPLATATRHGAELVYLNLRPGQLLVTDILHSVLDAVPIEAAYVMSPDTGPEPEIFGEFRGLLGTCLQPLSRSGFYQAARETNLAVAIASGDSRLFANILLTIGVVPPAGCGLTLQSQGTP